MKPIIILDSTPLGLLFLRAGIPQADSCREWVRQSLAAGAQLIVPEIVYYELRRELLRLRRGPALAELSTFVQLVPGRYLPITTRAMDLAAELWAQARQRGAPTADPHALDIDVVLAAQVLSAGFDPADFVVATSNVDHLAQFLPAATWESL